MTKARQDAERVLQETYREGMSQGLSQGLSQGRADAVLAVLAAKGIPVSDAVQEQIRGCKDLDVLQRWLLRAVTATTAEDVLQAA